MKYTGSCHCGKTQYEVEGQLDSVVECNCSMCRRKGTQLYAGWQPDGGDQRTLPR